MLYIFLVPKRENEIVFRLVRAQRERRIIVEENENCYDIAQ